MHCELFFFISGLQKLLVSLVAQEVQALPRGVHKSAMQGLRQSSNQSKVLASIPQLLLNKYEKNRQPGLKAALAGIAQFMNFEIIVIENNCFVLRLV